MKTIIELSHQEIQAALENGALKAFVDSVPWDTVKAVIGTQKREATTEPMQVPNPEPVQAPTQAPTEEVAYTFEQLQRACAGLVREGKRKELEAIVVAMQVDSIMSLKPEQFNAFAAKIREVGGVL
uniref:hypothetical protein n=1 Tax=Ndongobacter massiliensis TaxID=1871025 RepID=UPI0009313B3C|nr:hypothetical protein [Ndongobacter massiliensis]